MNSTALQMRQAMASKSTSVTLTSNEVTRMLQEIDAKLSDMRNDVGTVHRELCYRIRSFLRDSPNEGKCFDRDSRVEQGLQEKGFTVQYVAMPSARAASVVENPSDFYVITWT